MKTEALIGSLLVLLIIGFNQPVSFIAGKPEASQQSEVYHIGDLIVEGNETYVIENVTFRIRGGIHIRDDAKLIVRNAHVVIRDTYKDEFSINVMDMGHLIVENSVLNATYLIPATPTFLTPMADFMAGVHDNASIIMRNSFSHWRLVQVREAT